MSAPTRCWVAVLWSVATIAGRTTAFFILLTALNGGTIESNFPAQSISATPSFIPAATSAIGSESHPPVSSSSISNGSANSHCFTLGASISSIRSQLFDSEGRSQFTRLQTRRVQSPQPNVRVELHLTATDRSGSEGRERSSVSSNALLGGGSCFRLDNCRVHGFILHSSCGAELRHLRTQFPCTQHQCSAFLYACRDQCDRFRKPRIDSNYS